MDITKYQIYELTEENETELWKDCVFIFDSSALLDIYFFSSDTQKSIFEGIFEAKIKDRLWLPAHVQFEYLDNRKGVIKKPIKEKYDPLLDKFVSPIGENIKQTIQKIEELKQNIKNKDKHPHIDDRDILELEKALKLYKEANDKFDTNFKAKVEERKKEILQFEQKDTVLENLIKYFKIGREYSFKEILQIVEEGKLRYEFKIPPGYGDLIKEKKEGTQIFGDLIIWKQILEHAEAVKKNVVFVCNDITKQDWCILDVKATEKRIKAPRPELIKEFNDITGKRFWMYSQDQFIYACNKLLKSNIPNEQIEQIAKVLSEKAPDKFLVFKCDKCKKTEKLDTSFLNFEYECVGGSERQMGTENQYEAKEIIECPNCENKINGSFNIWEYPVGVINYTEVKLEGAKVVRPCLLNMNLNPEDVIINKHKVNLEPNIPHHIFARHGFDFYNTHFYFRYSEKVSGKTIHLSLKDATGRLVSSSVRLREGGHTIFQFDSDSFLNFEERNFGYMELLSTERISLEVSAIVGDDVF
jgi:hypothetical protein